MWRSMEETIAEIEIVETAVDAVLDAVRPGEVFGMDEYRKAVVALCPKSTQEVITAGILNSINDRKVEFTKFMLELRLAEGTPDSRLSGIADDDAKWNLTTKTGDFAVRKVA